MNWLIPKIAIFFYFTAVQAGDIPDDDFTEESEGFLPSSEAHSEVDDGPNP